MMPTATAVAVTGAETLPVKHLQASIVGPCPQFVIIYNFVAPKNQKNNVHTLKVE